MIRCAKVPLKLRVKLLFTGFIHVALCRVEKDETMYIIFGATEESVKVHIREVSA